MADFVAEVADQRAVRLVHLLADPLALDRIGLVDVDRDQAVGVAGEDRLVGGVGFEVELQRLLVADVFGRVAQAEVVELVEQLPLGQLEVRPAVAVSLDAEVRNDVVQPAGFAEADAGERIGDERRGRWVDRKDAIADGLDGVVVALRDGWPHFGFAAAVAAVHWHDWRNLAAGLAPGDLAAAADADGVVEEQSAAAGALKSVHGRVGFGVEGSVNGRTVVADEAEVCRICY